MPPAAMKCPFGCKLRRVPSERIYKRRNESPLRSPLISKTVYSTPVQMSSAQCSIRLMSESPEGPDASNSKPALATGQCGIAHWDADPSAQLGGCLLARHNTQINLVQSPQWHMVRTALIGELRLTSKRSRYVSLRHENDLGTVSPKRRSAMLPLSPR